MKRSRMLPGATSSLRYTRWRENPVSELNRSLRSAPIDGLAVNSPMSVYVRAVFVL